MKWVRRPTKTEGPSATGLVLVILSAALLFLIVAAIASAQEEGRMRVPVEWSRVRPVDEHPGPEPIGTPFLLVEPRLDVLFVLDATGSMGDEIQVVKEKMIEMIAEIERGEPRPEVRFGCLVYRDRGDEYVTLAHMFSVDTDACIEFIERIAAAGGGDGPESVNQALHEAIHTFNWDMDESVDRMIFLIGDAEPHFYPEDFRWVEEIEVALERDIIVHTIGCSGLSEEGVRVFKEIAFGTEGTFEYLTYRTQVTSTDGEEREVLYSGGTAYMVREDKKDEVSDGDWRLGADELISRGVLEVVDESVGHFVGEMIEESMAADMPARSSVAGARGRKLNNLDALLTTKIKQRLEKKGVTYEEEAKEGEPDDGDGEGSEDED